MSKKVIAGVVGDVTAYAYAKAGGYTGTEEEFQALMAANVEAAKYADEVRAAAAAANEDKEAAAESKDAAAASASAAAASQADAATSKAAAETAANYARTYTGAPRVAATAAAMTDQSLIYVYTGSETGYTAGNWYFWDGTTWTSGGVYNSTALETDETLTVSGAAADAKVTGDEIGALKSEINDLNADYNDHIAGGLNLFNPNDPDLVDNVELKNSGATAEKTGYFASGFIPVKPGNTYCFHYPTGTYGAASAVVIYDANKERLSYLSTERLTDGNGRGYIRFTIKESYVDVRYVRVTGYMANKSWYMYVEGNTMPTEYTPYTTNKALKDTDVDFSLIKNVEISKHDTDFIKASPRNLVDLSALVPGIITSSKSNGNIDTSGNYGTNWVTTDYIPVEPGATYALCIFPGNNYGTNFAGIPYYDENHNFLGRVKHAGGSVASIALRVTITLPNQDAIKYIRTSYYKSYTDSTGSDHKRWWMTQIFKASAWPSDAYVPYDSTDQIAETRLDDTLSGIYNPLWAKLAVWNGDSICAADSDTGAGWPGRIATANGMSYKNYGISGGTIAENTGSNVHSVSGTLDGMLTDFPNADYIIIEGGTNDADILGDNGIGTFDPDDFSTTYINALDKNTFSGALESVFYRLVTQMKGKHIGYLIPQKMGHTEVLVARRRVYFDRAKEIAKKWGIPVLDLWNDLYFNWRLSAHWDQSMTTAENENAGNLYIDGQHLTTTGYAVEAPVIAEWMRSI